MLFLTSLFTFKMTWASVDTERTGYIKPNQYMTFWRKLNGIFSVRIFSPEFSYKNLVKECSVEPNSMNGSSDPYQHHLDLVALNNKLNALDKHDMHAKRHDLEKIYWESALAESSTRGVSFNQMLLMLAKRKLIVPENALVLEELLENQKKEEAIDTLISIDRVRGLIETIATRKKFLKHLENKRNAQVPAIVIDNAAPSKTPIAFHDSTSYVGDSGRLSNASFFDQYLSSDEEEETKELETDEEDANQTNCGTESNAENIIEDITSYDLWEEMLRTEEDSKKDANK
ncbi:hypothetical protein A0J61_01495 [Choanephora cucurbitarum]|uniref:Uncharacterized protein n=1 Tax=Choanephora cucurbitarum TaxID=101091 RepID=A0A1C7NNB8_9FUNG|nr:hypothetical protein A0J61_01495 [Choanephora cucurbitarum]